MDGNFSPSNPAATPTGLINRLQNGAFAINPNGTESVSDGGVAFVNYRILTQSAAVQASRLTTPEAGQSYAGRITQSNATAQRFGIEQIIAFANCADLREALMAMSARIRFSIAGNVRFAILAWAGTADSVTADVVNDWTSESYIPGSFFISTVTVLSQGIFSTAAATFGSLPYIPIQGSATLNNIVVFIWTEDACAQNVTLDVGVWQLSAGNEQLSFEHRPIALEEALITPYTTVVYPEQFGAVGDGVTDDSPAFNDAIDYLTSTFGGGEVRCGPKTYGLASAVVIDADNLSIIGTPNRTILRGLGSAAISMIDIEGTTAASTTVSVNALQNSPTMTLTSATGFTAGSYIALLDTITSPITFEKRMMNRVAKISGSVVTLDRPLAIDMLAADSHSVTVATVRKRLTFRDLIFERGANAGDPTLGIEARYTAECRYENLTFRDFITGSGLLSAFGFANTYTNITTYNCGNAGYSDFWAITETAQNASNLISDAAYGFAQQWEWCHYCAGNNIQAMASGTGVAGRGIKFQASTRNTFSGLLADSVNRTGLAITEYSQYNLFQGVVTIGCRDPSGGFNANGVWFSEKYNRFNVIDGLVSLNNATADIHINLTDDYNVIRNAQYTNLYDVAGIGNIVERFSSGIVRTRGSVFDFANYDDGATPGPYFRLVRISSTPATGDGLGQHQYIGWNTSQEETIYAYDQGYIIDPADGAEYGQVTEVTMLNGTLTEQSSRRNGYIFGNPTGSFKGTGTANFAGDIYKNNTAYTNPKWVLQHYFTGTMDAEGPHAPTVEYTGLPSLEEAERISKEKCDLPLMAENYEAGLFERGDLLLASLEQAFLYIFQLNQRIKTLEARGPATP